MGTSKMVPCEGGGGGESFLDSYGHGAGGDRLHKVQQNQAD